MQRSERIGELEACREYKFFCSLFSPGDQLKKSPLLKNNKGL